MVTSIAIKRLFESFSELDSAIRGLRATTERNGQGNKVLDGRIRVYEEMLNKQKALALALCAYATLGNWNEVTRHIRLINGLSTMLRDDARELLSGLRPATKSPPDELMLS